MSDDRSTVRNGLAHDATVTADPDREVPVGADEPIATTAFDPATDRFTEQRELGRGGMGRVTEAFDHQLAREVAVKQLLVSDAATRRRFEREVRITARLEHPGIVPLYEAGRDPDGNPYYVMRRIDGEPLSKVIEAARDAKARLAIVPNVLAATDAIAFAHARAILHRDLKPPNILVGTFGETLVIDWGLAREIGAADIVSSERSTDDDLTRAGSVAGTPGYMAPEQARGESATRASDVYALGATLYYVLTGKSPYAGDGATTAIAKTAAAMPIDWKRVPDEVPPELRAIAQKAMAADEADRYPDAAALAADLRSFVAGNLVAAHRYTRWEQVRRFVRRHRAAVVIGAIATAAIAIVATLAIRQVLAARDEAVSEARSAEVARANEQARAEDAILASARDKLDDNPALAVALVRPLATGSRWRDARDVGAAARFAGVPWYFANPEVLQADFSPDGMRAYTLDSHGTVRIFDPVARTSRVLVELGGAPDTKFFRLLDGERFAIFDGTEVRIDTTRRSIAAPASDVTLGPNAIYWVDTAGTAWRSSLVAAAAPTRLPFAHPVARIWAAPDGKRVIASGTAGTELLVDDVATPAWPEPIDGLDFAADGYVGLSSNGVLWHYSATFAPTKLAPGFGQAGPGRTTISVVSTPETTFVSSPSLARVAGLITASFVSKARDHLVVVANANEIVIFDQTRRHRIVQPDMHANIVVARGHHLLVTTDDGTLIWDLDSMLARRISGFHPAFGADVSLGSHHVLVGALDGTSQWLDLASSRITPGPSVDPRGGEFSWTAPDGQRGLVLNLANEVRLVEPGQPTARTLATDATRAIFSDDDHVITVTKTNRLERITLASTTREVLAELDPALGAGALLAGRDHVAIAFKTKVVRIRTRDKQRDELAASGPSAMTADGRIVWVDDKTVKIWELDNRISIHAIAPLAIRNLVRVDDTHLLLDADDVGFVVDLAAPNQLRRTRHLGTNRIPTDEGVIYASSWTKSSARSLLAIPQTAGGGWLVDAITGAWWPYGQVGPATEPASPRITHDGQFLVERRQGDYAYWALALPDSPTATATFLAGLTNATVADDGGLQWPAQ